MFPTKKRLFFLILCLILPLAGLAEGDLIDSETIANSEEVYNTTTAYIGSFIKPCSGSGSIFYPKKTAIYYYGDSAIYSEFLVELHDEVKTGDPLIKFSPIVDDVEIAQLELNLRRAQEALAADEADYTANITVQFDDDSETASIRREIMETEHTQNVFRQQRAIKQIEKQLNDLYALKEGTTVCAPCDGFVSQISHFRDGEMITNGELICVVSMEDVRLISMEAGGFRYGMNVDITVGQGSKKEELQGRVIASNSVMPLMKQDHILVEMIDCEERSSWNALKISGETIHLDNVLMIPRKAIGMDGGFSYVMKLSEDGTPQHRSVSVGFNNASESWIVQGLDEGDNIILN